MGADAKSVSGKLRVLHVIPSVSPVHGGPSKAMVTMERALAAAGVCVTTATTDDDGPGRRLGLFQGARGASGATRFYARKWLDFYKVAPGIIPSLWRNLPTFDVVHIHALFSFTSVAACLLARLRRVPYVVRPLGTLASYGVANRRPWLKKLSLRLIEGPILRHAAAVHFTSQAEWDEAAALGIPVRGRVIPLGVERSSLELWYPVRVLGELQGRRGVLYLGRLDPIKNLEGLLHAAAQIDWGAAGAALLIAGDGTSTYVAELKRLGAALGLEDHILFLGYVEGARKAEVLAAASLFVLPSFSENFGIAVAEALLSGLPCVLGEGVGIAPQAKAAGAALVVSPHPDDIARSITILLEDDTKRRDMAVNAKRFAKREYSTAVMAERLIAMYRDVADSAAKAAT